MRRSPLPLAVLGVLPLLGCVLGTPTEGTTTVEVLKGKQGEYYYVNLFTPPLGGIITSDVGGIECGASSVSVDNGVSPPRYVYAWYPTASGTANRCGQTRFDWGQAVTLTATPLDGRVFIGWGGSCGGTAACALAAGADKSVVATFGLPGTGHGNYLDPAIHGPAYLAAAAGQSAMRCDTCHGVTLDGVGLAPSCNACHAAAGTPGWQTSCTFCHAAPPATAAHATVTGGLTVCVGCHAQSVTAAGTLVPGGRHLDGLVQAVGGGHAAGYAAPAVHGPEYLAFATGAGGLVCSSCHGADYAAPIAAGQSCNSCHAAAGSAAWQTDCTFCHAAPPATATHASVTGGLTACAGCHAQSVTTAGTLVAGGTHLDGTVQSTGGGHAVGYAAPAVHGPEYIAFATGAGGLACSTCHGADYAAPIAAGQSCNSCHAAAGFPSWQTACTFCHGAPPATAIHGGVTGLTACATCHAETVTAAGTLVAGGRHLDGAVQAIGAGHAAGFAAAAVHGPEYFAFVSGTGGLACTSCHGADYSAPIAAGQSCNSCHAAAGWTGWQQNCSFCHGQKSVATQAGYLLADHPTWAAPPDAVSQRLGGPAVPARSGAHAIHLTGSALARPLLCQTCHAVPSGPAHVSGRAARAAVVLSGAGQGSLPAALGSYSAAAGTCLTACHGTSASPAWSTTGLACGGCHATPPATPTHASVTGGLTACAACHPGTMNADGTIKVAGGLHVDGAVQSTSPHAAGYAAAAQHGAAYLNTLGGVSGALDCASCHGAALTSCNTCHASAAGGAWVSWQTNCTFCHGTKTNPYTAANLNRADPSTGRHGNHGSVSCATCHTVPTTLSHVGGATARATVILSGYSPTTRSCNVSCHGTENW